MQNQRIIVGNCSDNGLYTYIFKNGSLIHSKNTNDVQKCTYIAKNDDIIYGVIEVQDDDNNGNGYVVSYKSEKDGLVYIDKEISYGQGPCHISVNKNKNLIAVSNYVDGYLTIYRMENSGHIGKKIYNNVVDKKWSHMHFTQMFYDNFFLCAIDIGTSTILVYKICENEIKEYTRLSLGTEIEPRHMVIIDNAMYVVTERSCKLYIIEFDGENLKIKNTQSILPNDIDIKSGYTGCAIKASKDNKFLYISIRGHNSISVLKREKGEVRIIQNVKCQGDTPRDIELDKSGTYLFVANQVSNDISIFKRNKNTGKLYYLKKKEAQSPTCIITE